MSIRRAPPAAGQPVGNLRHPPMSAASCWRTDRPSSTPTSI
jgi:hypothetical protein